MDISEHGEVDSELESEMGSISQESMDVDNMADFLRSGSPKF